MNELSLKIFDVLTKKISVSEFENWLYNSEFLQNDLKENSLVFDVININYRNPNALKVLKNITSNVFDDKDLIIMKIIENCYKIINANNSRDYEKYVYNIIENYNFDIECEAYWEFYYFYNGFNGYDFYNNNKKAIETLNSNVFNYAKTIIEKFNRDKNIDDIKPVLKLKPEITKINLDNKNSTVHNKKVPFMKKIFAFFKKI